MVDMNRRMRELHDGNCVIVQAGKQAHTELICNRKAFTARLSDMSKRGNSYCPMTQLCTLDFPLKILFVSTWALRCHNNVWKTPDQ